MIVVGFSIKTPTGNISVHAVLHYKLVWYGIFIYNDEYAYIHYAVNALTNTPVQQ